KKIPDILAGLDFSSMSVEKDPNDKRRETRFPFNIKAAVALPHSQKAVGAEIININLVGVGLVVSKGVFRQSDKISIEILSTASIKGFTLGATVKRVVPAGEMHVLGCKITQLTSLGQKSLALLVESA